MIVGYYAGSKWGTWIIVNLKHVMWISLKDHWRFRRFRVFAAQPGGFPLRSLSSFNPLFILASKVREREKERIYSAASASEACMGKFDQGLYRVMFSHKFLFLIAKILLEKGAAKTNCMQSNLLQSSWWHMSQSWRELNQYVYVVNTVNHRAVAHTWLFHIFWTVACGVIMKDSIKKQQEKNDPLHFWTHTQQAT